MHKKVVATLLVVGSFSLGMMATVSPDVTNNIGISAQAKTKSARIISTKKLAKQAVHVTKGSIYTSAKLTKVTDHAKDYKNTTFYRTKQAKVVKTNGKKAVYQYITTSNGKVKGWIWHSYVKNGEAPKDKVATKSTVFDEAKANQEFLAIINKGRAQRNLAPLTIDTTLTQLAQKMANQNGIISDDDFNIEVQRLGLASGQLLEADTGGGTGTAKNSNLWAEKAANEVLPAEDIATKGGHGNPLLNAKVITLGIAWYPNQTKGYCAYALGVKD